MKNDNKFSLQNVIYILVIFSIIFLIGVLFFCQTKPFNIRSLNRRDWLYISLILLFSFSFYLVLSIKYEEIKKSLVVISTAMFLTLSIYYYLMSKISMEYQTTLSLLVSSLFICAGWWTQSTINRSSQRKSHTLNLIMNQRFSDLYMRKNDDLVKAFGMNITVHPDWSDRVFKIKDQPKPSFQNPLYASEYFSYVEGIKGLSYLLNFYEFAAVGILKGDLDDKMMKECFSGAVCRIEKRAFFLIRYSIARDPNAYENFIKLMTKWGNESLVIKYKDKTDDTICNDSSFIDIFTISKKPTEFLK
ncbi:TPA: DUF4760 domain-containing protein [Serratia marcescens]|uniref:DUF4760 domain-containing protein n=1 Tax=Serratia marcescens TaxID=615 RepID=A0AB33FYP0_SERMA|nr:MULTISPECIES: DUF4760 domain-containing protein [Enterobacterales]AWL70360.1 DUF4760 domain-containing protein [Serratia marcescens]MDP8606125.1 DUF4760 domain-containing protein [Serratia marcescens]MDP8874753.1 DUF4760 domain-containing protein [Serratia marcescens]QLR43989.1 DUF4760 domain-containing protein [Enterobacter sp. RHBSTW-00994]UBI63304.1 DUF4760 domain-containing protein [Serratia sp. HRI]